MKRMFKRTLSLLLAAVMLFGASPIGALSEIDFPSLRDLFTVEAEAATYSGTCGDNLTWILNTSTGVLTISGTGAMTNWQYSSNAPWHSNHSSIKSVTIGNSVTSIGYSAFEDCDSLTSVTIGDSVTSIGSYAFYSCYSLTSITIPDSVTSIGSYAFCYCDSLTSVTIGNGVKSIGDDAFGHCYSLTSITVDKNNSNYSSDEYGVLFNKDKTELIQYPVGNGRTSYTIPDSVTSIGNHAFDWCYSLTSVTIPDSVTSIGDDAFGHCYSLTSITIPDSVTSIGSSAFYYCYSLTDVYYSGTEEEWNKISIGSYNKALTNATIHFNYKPAEDAEIELPEDSGIIIKDNFIIGLPMNVTSETIPDYIPVTGGGSIVCDSDMIGTGTVVQIVDAVGEVVDEYELVFTGDINGDIIISTSDLVTLKSMCSGAVEIAENTAYWYAADMNGDGMITSTDMTLIRSIINGVI